MHIVISFYSFLLENVLHEIKHNFKAKFKESDLFRVYQSIDLGNLDPKNEENAAFVPALMKLREYLYSQEYRHFIEDISCIDRGTLTNLVDCAVNCHDKGCHLLCHDDVIGTRKISYIIYLTDPDPVWKDEDGGRLELYDGIEEIIQSGGKGDGSKTIKRKVPGAIPVKTIIPKFNCMAYFEVVPGGSFHSVQEVFCDRPRLSIQGWYHAKSMPNEMENASLNQLKSNQEDEIIQEDHFTHILDSTNKNDDEGNQKEQNDLTACDIEFLSKYINPIYLKSDSVNDIRQRFEEDSCVQLRHFFREDWEEKISSMIFKEDKEQKMGKDQPALDYSKGVNEHWKLLGPAHKQRFLEYVGDSNSTSKGGTNCCGSLLAHLKQAVFSSPQFGKLLSKLTSLGMPLGYNGKIRRFRPGLDYTIAHYGILTRTSVLDLTMCFVRGNGKQSLGEDGENEDDTLWQSDDKGGFECYIAADDDDDGDNGEEAADEYDEEDDTKLLSVSASNNTLSLVYRDPGTMRFVKYVGCGAPSSRWDISLEYKLNDDDSDEIQEGCKDTS